MTSRTSSKQSGGGALADSAGGGGGADSIGSVENMLNSGPGPVFVLFGAEDPVVIHSNEKSNNLLHGLFCKSYGKGGLGVNEDLDCDVVAGLGHQFLTDHETPEQNEACYRMIRRACGVEV